jgi:hypothetical protein
MVWKIGAITPKEWPKLGLTLVYKIDVSQEV